ncbi:hypothetical protein ACFLRA_00785 [Bdellovibrionota bacterium]
MKNLMKMLLILSATFGLFSGNIQAEESKYEFTSEYTWSTTYWFQEPYLDSKILANGHIFEVYEGIPTEVIKMTHKRLHQLKSEWENGRPNVKSRLIKFNVCNPYEGATHDLRMNTYRWLEYTGWEDSYPMTFHAWDCLGTVDGASDLDTKHKVLNKRIAQLNDQILKSPDGYVSIIERSTRIKDGKECFHVNLASGYEIEGGLFLAEYKQNSLFQTGKVFNNIHEAIIYADELFEEYLMGLEEEK